VETLINEIREQAEGMLPDKSYFIVRVSLTGSKGHRRLEILADGDHGIDIDVCSRLSRDLSEWLDSKNLIDEHYVLEVGSPGIDYPLDTPRQYKKNIGRMLKIIKNDGSVVKGKLKGIENTGITVEADQEKKRSAPTRVVNIGFDQIRKSTVFVSFK
jgi:ribosome maturation factor RimP